MEHAEQKPVLAPANTTETPTSRTFTVSDFSITELEDRLEMVDRCNGRCDKR